MFKLSSVGLYVRDLAEAKKFYTEIVGYHVVEAFTNDDFVFLAGVNGTPFYLQDLDDLPPGVNAEPGGVALGFEVENIEDVWRDWKAKDVELLTEVADMGAGLHFYAKDPEGHCICIIQMYPQSMETQKKLGIGP